MGNESKQTPSEPESADPAEQAAAEQAATLAHGDGVPGAGLSRQELLEELAATRRQRNEAFAEVETWRQGSLIAAALVVAGVLIFFWPF
jgi:acyl-CoA reductase-like NAD-dependent aldehyde dehydrogenase